MFLCIGILGPIFAPIRQQTACREKFTSFSPKSSGMLQTSNKSSDSQRFLLRWHTVDGTGTGHGATGSLRHTVKIQKRKSLVAFWCDLSYVAADNGDRLPIRTRPSNDRAHMEPQLCVLV